MHQITRTTRCHRIAIYDRHFGLYNAELKLDGEPGGAPDEDCDDVQKGVAHFGDNNRMTQPLLFLPIILPALFWAAYHYHKDRHLPEPIGNLLLCFGPGDACGRPVESDVHGPRTDRPAI